MQSGSPALLGHLESPKDPDTGNHVRPGKGAAEQERGVTVSQRAQCIPEDVRPSAGGNPGPGRAVPTGTPTWCPEPAGLGWAQRPSCEPRGP